MELDETGRLAAIDGYGLLTTPPARDLQALVALAAQIFGTDCAALNIITDSHQHQVATIGVEPEVCARSDSMCGAVLTHPDPIVVGDATQDERYQANPYVNGEIGDVRFYASAPLVTPDGFVLGRLCVFDETVRSATMEQAGALAVLADRVVDVLELRLRSESLERSLEELTLARDELRRSNERLSLFAGQVSHDLRTPLTAILLNTEIALGEPAVQEEAYAVEVLTAALASGQRMYTLMQRVLEDARVGSKPQLEEVDLAAVLGEVMTDLAPVLRAREAHVHAEELPVVEGDHSQLYSVLLNLLSNALKFAHSDRAPSVALRSQRTPAGWRVEVSDNGIGIAPENRERVFDLFVRESGEETGAGIGLATVKHIVTSHGGTVGLDAGPDGGTTAWFELPA